MDKQAINFPSATEINECVRVANEYRNQYIRELSATLAKNVRAKFQVTISRLAFSD
ncbi:MAG: hypothetical protein HUJ18_13050 [Marinobacter sp.]|nr:hypothetical protein [Marinobacter sp.]